MGSGCLGLVYFTDVAGRVSMQEVEKSHPRLIPKLIANPCIGFIMIKDQQKGAVVIGRGGRRYLESDKVEGKDPLANFGPQRGPAPKKNQPFQALRGHCD